MGAMAAAHGRVNLLKELHAARALAWGEELCWAATCAAHTPVLTWLAEQSPPCPWGLQTVAAALQRGPHISDHAAPRTSADSWQIMQLLVAHMPGFMLGEEDVETAAICASDQVLDWLLAQPGVRTGLVGMVPPQISDGRLLQLAAHGWKLSPSQRQCQESLPGRRAALLNVIAEHRTHVSCLTTIADLPLEITSYTSRFLCVSGLEYIP